MQRLHDGFVVVKSLAFQNTQSHSFVVPSFIVRSDDLDESASFVHGFQSACVDHHRSSDHTLTTNMLVIQAHKTVKGFHSKH